MPHTASTAEYGLRKYAGDDDQGPARVNTKGMLRDNVLGFATSRFLRRCKS
jgi:hypothetical protein